MGEALFVYLSFALIFFGQSSISARRQIDKRKRINLWLILMMIANKKEERPIPHFDNLFLDSALKDQKIPFTCWLQRL